MKAFFASLWEKLKGMFTKNLGIKISAVVFALLLWAYVLVVLNPVRTKLIDKVPISLEGYNDLLSRNLILVEQDLGQASVSVEAAITSHASLDASRINCRASLSTITGPGTYKLTVSATTQGNLGTVSKVSPSIVEVEVDKLIKKDIPVKVTYGESKLPEGYEILSENYSTSITVEGAARFVESAVRAEAAAAAQGNRVLRVEQQDRDNDRRRAARDNGRGRRTGNAPFQAEDHDRVADQVDDVDQTGDEHGHARVALCAEQRRACVIDGEHGIREHAHGQHRPSAPKA